MGLNQIVLLAASAEERSLGERFGTALLNTVMGIAIVFLVLIVISGLISCFKYINQWEQKANSKNVQAAPVEKAAPVVEAVEEDLSDDLELVAVITAAINSYEESMGHEVPANGLYVRSIRKVNRSKWQNA